MTKYEVAADNNSTKTRVRAMSRSEKALSSSFASCETEGLPALSSLSSFAILLR